MPIKSSELEIFLTLPKGKKEHPLINSEILVLG